MSQPKPTWRKVFDQVERTLGEPLESAVASYPFVGVMSAGMRTRRAVTGAAGRVVGSVLHMVNIATRDDVQRLNHNLATLAGEVRAINAAPSAPPTGTRKPAKAASGSNRTANTSKPTPPAKTAKATKATKATKSTQSTKSTEAVTRARRDGPSG